MKFNTSFNLSILCKVYPVDDEDPDKVEDKIVVLSIDLETAEHILFRFSDPAFYVGKYKMLFKFDHYNKPKMITMFYENYMYLIVDSNSFINEVMKGYRILLRIDDLIDQSTFDYQAAVDLLEDNTKPAENVDDEGARYSAYI